MRGRFTAARCPVCALGKSSTRSCGCPISSRSLSRRLVLRLQKSGNAFDQPHVSPSFPQRDPDSCDYRVSPCLLFTCVRENNAACSLVPAKSALRCAPHVGSAHWGPSRFSWCATPASLRHPYLVGNAPLFLLSIFLLFPFL